MKLSDKYYTGVEVQKMLGITEPSLRNLVQQKKIRKVTPPGRKNGVYLRNEIDKFAAQWEAFLMAKEPPKTTFRIAKSEDMVAQEKLDTRAIGAGGMPVETLKAWLEANGETDYHVYHDNDLVAFMNLVPIKREIIEKLLKDEIHWRDIDPKKDIEKFVPGKPVDLYVSGIASEPDVDEDTRRHYMLILLRGAGQALKDLGQRGIIIKHVYGRSQTPTGIAMALHMGMKEYEPILRKGKLIRFVLDVEKSDKFLANMYREGYAIWQKEQKQNSKRRTAVSNI